MTMNRILFLTTALAFASCVQQKVVVPPPAVLPTAPMVTAPAPTQTAKAAPPVAKQTPAPKSAASVAAPAPQSKPVVPAAPAPLKPLRGTHSSIIQESDRVQTARSMGGSATYAH